MNKHIQSPKLLALMGGTLLFSGSLLAADKGELEANKLYATPIPVIGYNPANGTIYGVGASMSMVFGEPKSTKVSNMLAGVARTTLDQTIATFKSTAYGANNDWIFQGDWRYLDSSQPTFGLGTGPDSAKLVTSGAEIEYNDDLYSGTASESQLMAFKYLRLYETAFRRISGNWYAGLGYHLDKFSDIDDKLLDLDSNVLTSHYSYNTQHGFSTEESMISGLSINALYDSRDSVINSYEGSYALATYRYNPEFLGSDQDSSTLWLEYRGYWDVSASEGQETPDVLALWSFANIVTSGDVPYMGLPALGWDQYARSGEGYVQGRFRGQDLFYMGAEYRKHFGALWGIEMGGVLFANATSASATGENDIALFEYIEPGYGAGLRFMLSKRTRTNIGIDYGAGNYESSGIYIRLNENF